MVTATSPLLNDWRQIASAFDQIDFLSLDAVKCICEYFKSKWLSTDVKNRVQKFVNLKHKSPLILQLLGQIQTIQHHAQSNMHSNPEAKSKLCKRMKFLEVFAFNNVNLYAIEKANGLKIVMDTLVMLNASKQGDTDPQLTQSSTELIEHIMIVLSVILRNESGAISFLNQNRAYVGNLANNFREHKKNEKVMKPTILVIRLLLVNEESVDMFTKQFKGLDSMIKLLLGSSICDFTICTHLMFSKYQIEN